VLVSIDQALESDDCDTAADLACAFIHKFLASPERVMVEKDGLVLPAGRALAIRVARMRGGQKAKVTATLEALAARTLERARTGGWLPEAVERFRGTKAAREASTRLADEALERGDGAAALPYLRSAPDSDVVRLKRAVAAAMTGDATPLTRLLEKERPARAKALSEFVGAMSAGEPHADAPPLREAVSALRGPGRELFRAERRSDAMRPRQRRSMPGFLPRSAPKAAPRPALLDHTACLADLSGYSGVSTAGVKRFSARPGERLTDDFWFCPVPARPATDGERVFFNLSYRRRIRLAALDGRRGKLLWHSGQASETSNLSFCSPPICRGGRVFALAYGEDVNRRVYYLVCVDVLGRPLWRCRLGSTVVPKSGVRRVPLARATSRTCPPGFLLAGEGVVWFTTNSGAIGAVSADSGRLLWMWRYPAEPFSSGAGNLPFIMSRTSAPGLVEPVLVRTRYKRKVRRVLIEAPLDSALLVGIDVDRLKWWWRPSLPQRSMSPLPDGTVAVAERKPPERGLLGEETSPQERRLRVSVYHPVTARLLFRESFDESLNPSGDALACADGCVFPLGEALAVLRCGDGKRAVTFERGVRAQSITRLDGKFLVYDGERLTLHPR